MHVAYLYSNGDPEVRLTRLYLTTLGGRDAVLSNALDRPIGDFVWSADSRSLIATAPDRTTNSLYRISLRGGVRRLDVGNVVPGVPLNTTGGASTPSLRNALASNGSLVFLASATAQPIELFRYTPANGAVEGHRVQRGDDRISIGLPPARHVSDDATGVTGDGVPLSAAGLFCATAYPLVVFIHGGPADPTLSSSTSGRR